MTKIAKPRFDFVSKRQYVAPSMEIVESQPNQKLLFGSLVEGVSADFDEDINQVNFQDDPTVNMWEEAL